MPSLKLPIPPVELRQLVGPTDEEQFDNPTGDPALPHVPRQLFFSILDFGCGCGRLARKLIQQDWRPTTYLGVDLHAGMINWCQQNLAPAASGFSFEHHDVFNAGFNPGAEKPRTLPLPGASEAYTLMIAWSVFTHTTQRQTEHYLTEAKRVLTADGILFSTWFFSKNVTFQ